MVSAGRLTVVGLGPGALDQITPEAAAALHAADIHICCGGKQQVN